MSESRFMASSKDIIHPCIAREVLFRLMLPQGESENQSTFISLLILIFKVIFQLVIIMLFHVWFKIITWIALYYHFVNPKSVI